MQSIQYINTNTNTNHRSKILKYLIKIGNTSEIIHQTSYLNKIAYYIQL